MRYYYIIGYHDKYFKISMDFITELLAAYFS